MAIGGLEGHPWFWVIFLTLHGLQAHKFSCQRQDHFTALYSNDLNVVTGSWAWQRFCVATHALFRISINTYLWTNKKLHNLHDFKRAWYWLWYHLRWIAGDRDHPDSTVISPRKKWKKACNSNKNMSIHWALFLSKDSRNILIPHALSPLGWDMSWTFMNMSKNMFCHFHEFHMDIFKYQRSIIDWYIQCIHHLMDPHGPCPFSFPSLASTFHKRLRQQASANAQYLVGYPATFGSPWLPLESGMGYVNRPLSIANGSITRRQLLGFRSLSILMYIELVFSCTWWVYKI